MAILALSSVFWREAWKYGERALRYCNHDVRHALAAVALAAATLGWDARLLDGLSDEDLGRLVGVEKGSPRLLLRRGSLTKWSRVRRGGWSGSIQIARFCYSQLGLSRRSTMNINGDNGLACLTKISGASSASTVSPLPHIASSA
ncbi:hypothetical protein Zm00014a_000768 [Zea mays]|uniref:Uncharacterized protein n=1 Tax=Zea mays TaxID=4577 RepID=A0A3L6FLN8_MAIZE|nr:hypothetical protein Zm00014a_000768 [Zea mays]